MARLFRLIHRGCRWLARRSRSLLLQLGVRPLIPEILLLNNKIMLTTKSKMTRTRLLVEYRDFHKIAVRNANRTDVHKSDKHNASLDGVVSARLHSRAAALRLFFLEISANRRDWRSFSKSSFRKRVFRIEQVDGLACFGPTDFLEERIVRFPEELTESYKPGFTSLGGLGRCHWLAWRILIRLCEPATSRQAPILRLNVNRSFFVLARQLATAHRAKVVLERNLSVPACLIRTSSLNVIYIDGMINREYWPFLVYHELAHLILDHQGVSSRFFLEGPESEPALGLQEMEADALASVLDHLMRGLVGIAEAVGNPNVSSDANLPATPLRCQLDPIELKAEF